MKAILSFFNFGKKILFIFALTFHKCQIVKKAFLFIFLGFLMWYLFGVFFLVSVSVFFGVFYGVRGGWRNLFFLLWAPCCSFFRRASCVRFFF